MIQDHQKNRVYLADSLFFIEKYLQFSEDIIELFIKNNIPYGIIKGTKDIWIKDYMPIQVNGSKFINFNYAPLYLKYFREDMMNINVRDLFPYDKRYLIDSDLNIDGGNLCCSANKIYLTDRIFIENFKYPEEEVYKKLSMYFGVAIKNIIIIPSSALEPIAHIDGMVRPLNDLTVMISDFSYLRKDREEIDRIYIELAKHGLNILHVPVETGKQMRNAENIYSALGYYINYLEIDNYVIMPTFDRRSKDKLALRRFQDYFSHKEVLTIDATPVALEGGVLNCVTWAVKD